MWNIFHWGPINYDHPVVFSGKGGREKKKKKKKRGGFKRSLHENTRTKFIFFQGQPMDFIHFSREFCLKTVFVIQTLQYLNTRRRFQYV